jgi:hypothetical protein
MPFCSFHLVTRNDRHARWHVESIQAGTRESDASTCRDRPPHSRLRQRLQEFLGARQRLNLLHLFQVRLGVELLKLLRLLRSYRPARLPSRSSAFTNKPPFIPMRR